MGNASSTRSPGTSGTTSNQTYTYTDGVQNVVYFDGHVEGLSGLEFWPWSDGGGRDALGGLSMPLWVPFNLGWVADHNP